MKALGEAFSHFEKQAAALSGERGCCKLCGQRATVAGLLVGVLTGLGGASQEDQQSAISGGNDVNKEARWMDPPGLFIFP